MPTKGGLPTRLTHHPDPDRMLDWYPDGKDILFGNPMTSEKRSFRKLYRVPATGGLPEVLPCPTASSVRFRPTAPHSPTC
jgi:tricorn protease